MAQSENLPFDKKNTTFPCRTKAQNNGVERRGKNRQCLGPQVVCMCLCVSSLSFAAFSHFHFHTTFCFRFAFCLSIYSISYYDYNNNLFFLLRFVSCKHVDSTKKELLQVNGHEYAHRHMLFDWRRNKKSIGFSIPIASHHQHRRQQYVQPRTLTER